MIYLWYIYGISMVYLWYIYGIFMVYLWYMDSQSTYHNWLTPNICPKCQGFHPRNDQLLGGAGGGGGGSEAWRLHSSPTFPPGSVPATPRVQWCLGLEMPCEWAWYIHLKHCQYVVYKYRIYIYIYICMYAYVYICIYIYTYYIIYYIHTRIFTVYVYM